MKSLPLPPLPKYEDYADIDFSDSSKIRKDVIHQKVAPALKQYKKRKQNQRKQWFNDNWIALASMILSNTIALAALIVAILAYIKQ